MASRGLPALPASSPASLAAPMVPQAYVNPGLSVPQVLSILRAYRKQTALIALLAMFLTGVISKVTPKIYTATATLMVNYQPNYQMAANEVLGGLPVSYMATQIELMQSAEVLLPVIDRLKLTENKRYIAGYHGDGSTLREWVQRALVKNLTIEQGKAGSQLVYVTYSASNPVEAAQVANAVADVYMEQQIERLNGPATENVKRYTQQLEELKDKVNRAQEQVTQFRQRTGLIDLQAKIDADTEQMNALQQRLMEAQNTRRTLEVSMAGNQAVGDRVLASPGIQTLKGQLATQEAQMAQLRTTLGPKHPQVMELQAQMDATRKAISDETQVYVGNTATDLSGARQLEQKLQKAFDEQRTKVLATRQIQDEGTKYLLELESAQTVYKRALDSYDQIMFATSAHATNVNFVSRATPPVRHSKPNTIKNIIQGTIAGTFLGLVGPLVYGLLFNRRIRCRDDIERDYGIPVLVEFDAISPRRSLA
jgi:uncharacterized protein involved in exopolysaccharide biosynthesis